MTRHWLCRDANAAAIVDPVFQRVHSRHLTLGPDGVRTYSDSATPGRAGWI